MCVRHANFKLTVTQNCVCRNLQIRSINCDLFYVVLYYKFNKSAVYNTKYDEMITNSCNQSVGVCVSVFSFLSFLRISLLTLKGRPAVSSCCFQFELWKGQTIAYKYISYGISAMVDIWILIAGLNINKQLWAGSIYYIYFANSQAKGK